MKLHVLMIVSLTTIVPAIQAKSMKSVAVNWATTDAATDYTPRFLESFMESTFKLDSIVDARNSKETIGENLERKEDPRVYVATNSIRAFVEHGFREVFSKYDVRMSDEGYQYRIVGELRTFRVTEESTYKGQVRIAFHILDTSSDTVCSCLAEGTSKRWGRSYSEEMYNECISNTLFSCVASLMDKCDPQGKGK